VDRKRLKDNPVAQVELVKETRGKVGILTPAQMKALLAEAHEPDVLATLAIGGFAGLRPEEIARLKWSAIDLDHGQIDCAGDITKTAKSRYVKIEPVLAAWLRHGCATVAPRRSERMT
jgi:integrase